MNDIVEINYPNLDNYFKDLLIKQEFSRKCYWSYTMKNNIVEFGYPNLDNYFKNLLEIQQKKYEVRKEKWQNHFKDFFAKFIPVVISMIIVSILNHLITLDYPNAVKLILVIGDVIAAIYVFVNGFIFIFHLPLFFLSSYLIFREIMNYKSYNEREILRTIKDDFDVYLNSSNFTFDSKGFITDLKRDDKELCQKIEEHLKTNKKEVI